ncbi:MAG TPA: DNA-processing protein DprA [Haliangium sp.]|nr:DNA-processing protein DprA [Haliangium sp.]
MPDTDHIDHHIRARQGWRRSPGWRRGYRPPEDIATVHRDQAFWPPLTGAALARAPERLYTAGDAALLRAPMRVAIAGARRASDQGCGRSARLARALASAGAVIVSGLARGIDAAAHLGAIEAGGATMAVLGVPLGRCYPPEHAWLQEQIYRGHLLVSQFADGARTHAWCFPARNRTMAMLARAAVIVEAGETSGSLTLAAETRRLGRPLFLARSLVENPSLTWPRAFLARGALTLDDLDDLDTAARHVLDLAGRAG